MKLTINHASRRYVNEDALKWGGRVIALLMLIIIVLQLSTVLTLRTQNSENQLEIATLEQQLVSDDSIRLDEGQLSRQKQEIIQAQIILQKDAFRWTGLFDRMEELLPKEVSIRSFNPNYKSNNLMLTGVAVQLSDLQEFINNLHADSFTRVLLKSQGRIEVTDSSGRKRPALAFSILLEGLF